MLRLTSLHWNSKSFGQLTEKLEALGFSLKNSERFPNSKVIDFGPDSIIISTSDKDSISTFEFESDDISGDYAKLKTLSQGKLEKPWRAKDTQNGNPLWYGFNIPNELLSGGFKAQVVMNSPELQTQLAKETLPYTHNNTCFGIEAIHIRTSQLENLALKWEAVFSKHPAGLQWKEGESLSGKRFLVGERFFDIINDASTQKDTLFMITLKVADLEQAKERALKLGVKVQNCENRDGFIIPAEFTGGPALRLTRSFWKRYLPTIPSNFPNGRRTDQYRPLGGAFSSTLREGFEDNWDY